MKVMLNFFSTSLTVEKLFKNFAIKALQETDNLHNSSINHPLKIGDMEL